MAVYNGTGASLMPAWPERRVEHTYCAYCGRRHSEGGSNCEGCGAPVTAPGRIEALQQKLDADDLVDVTEFGDVRQKLLSLRTGRIVDGRDMAPRLRPDRVLR